MLLEPKMNGIDGAADFVGDLRDGRVGFKNEGEGLLADLRSVTNSRHDRLGAGGVRIKSGNRINDAIHYHASTKSSNNGDAGAITRDRSILERIF